MHGIVDLVESYEKKFNPAGTPQGMRAAHREIGLAVRKLVESKKLEPSKVSFLHLYRKLVQERGLEEEGNLVSSAFPTIAGQLISSRMIAGYTDWPDETGRLVTVVPSKLKISNVVGWTNMTGVDRVTEREDYPQAKPPSEKTKTINNYKYGGIVDITKEALFFDQTGELLAQATNMGRLARKKRMRLIWDAIIDVNGTAYGGADLYSAGNGNEVAANPLTGDTAWETARSHMMAKVDENSEPIWLFGQKPVMIVPSGLLATAEKLQKNPTGYAGTANLDVNLAQNQFDIIVNPYLSATSTTWWYGWPWEMFRWEEVWPFEVFSRVGQDTEEGFKADIIQQVKCSFYGGVGAADKVYVDQHDAT
ncbi:MAG: hypothetical protein UMS36scaffold28_11 [Phage 59_13]|nr:MAG: hypothetical protein UMS36scaffold28_11 [Phage 59_13]